MKYFLMFFLVSCGQNYNSNSFDADRYGPEVEIDISSPEGSRFAAAYNLLDSQCIKCHDGTHSFWAGFTTEQDWIDVGYVNAGDFDNSFIIKRLKNYGSDMPQGGQELTDNEIEILQEWINNL